MESSVHVAFCDMLSHSSSQVGLLARKTEIWLNRLHADTCMGCHDTVYLTTDDVIAATRATMEDTIQYINDEYGSAANYLKEVCQCFGRFAVCVCVCVCEGLTAEGSVSRRETSFARFRFVLSCRSSDIHCGTLGPFSTVMKHPHT